MKKTNPNSTGAPVPYWYGASEAYEISTSPWVPPLAAGLAVRAETFSLVVLRHQALEPVYIQQIPLADGMTAVNAGIAAAVDRLSNFSLNLCCAIEPWSEVQKMRKAHPESPWFWVEYPHAVTYDVYDKTQYLSEAWDKPHYYALALATQLQQNFTLLQDFDREARRLLDIGDSVQALPRIALSRIPQDMHRLARFRHDLSF
jgi:hypothetical protein